MDKNTFGKLVLDNEVQLYRIAKAILKRDEDCADAAQEAITRAFEKLHTLKQDAYAKTWLIRILIRECYRILEQRSKEAAFQENQSVQVSESEDYGSLYQALAALEPEFRITLVLYYLEGFQIQEISAMLEIPEGTVKSRLHRGRKKLKKLLSEEERQ
ncbi:MAG: sigma-70 family RNA polymerase sigma factor [Eubacteriales bacterium]|nr:sigma-70 family RNA polymerase sigma factor [Eubacteriales bacterium]